MKKIKGVMILLTMLLIIVSSSCNPDDDNLNDSRVVKYEIAGVYSGNLIASYTTATGGTANEPIASLPWIKDITYNSNVSAAIIAISGNGGVAGQQVTVIIKRGGTQVSSTTATADNSGSFSRAAPVITF